jgi:beta-glucosidase/6-phospho-beta-glucosidase/beta-galactosidase
MDNSSWIGGHMKRYEFLYVHRETRERKPKASSYWSAEPAARNGSGD